MEEENNEEYVEEGIIKKEDILSEVPKVVKMGGGQEQIHELLFGEKLSWQAIIYDLINTEQLDVWDVDLMVLSNRYLEKLKVLEEANCFVS